MTTGRNGDDGRGAHFSGFCPRHQPSAHRYAPTSNPFPARATGRAARSNRGCISPAAASPATSATHSSETLFPPDAPCATSRRARAGRKRFGFFAQPLRFGSQPDFQRVRLLESTPHRHQASPCFWAERVVAFSSLLSFAVPHCGGRLTFRRWNGCLFRAKVRDQRSSLSRRALIFRAQHGCCP
ncbi:hypothetical protein SAMN05216338_101843 [Bradyrhizobium sp. Rc2d]|nr:hypothetical protein SAMN05216338_101843 [Bradyrhizobium sp. Rc2d]